MMKKRFATAVTIALAAASIFGCSNSASQSKQTTQAAAAMDQKKTPQKQQEVPQKQQPAKKLRPVQMLLPTGRKDLWRYILD
ncbi:MAG: hypothetical protein ACLRZZ_24195 [Enterocloster sp.]